MNSSRTPRSKAVPVHAEEGHLQRVKEKGEAKSLAHRRTATVSLKVEQLKRDKEIEVVHW